LNIAPRFSLVSSFSPPKAYSYLRFRSLNLDFAL
jgi:hypothetical protein